MSRLNKILIVSAAVILLAAAGFIVYGLYFSPTRILVVNALPAQAAELKLNKEDMLFDLTCVKMEDAADFNDYDAVVMFGRGLFLDSLQMRELDEAVAAGLPVYTYALRNFSFVINENIDESTQHDLDLYLRNGCRENYRNFLRRLRCVATPRKLNGKEYAPPLEMAKDMYYHVEEGRYFKKPEDLEKYLRERGLYNKDGRKVVFISGVNFPVEGNRAHVDSLISRLTREGYNVYPLTATGKMREQMILDVDPDAVIYLPMGRLGDDSLINKLYERNVPLFMPFPLTQTREEWLDVSKPIGGGTLTARVVVPEIDGAMTPLCLATQDPDQEGYLIYRPVKERMDAFMEQFTRFMDLRTKPNFDKRVAVCYFKSPGRDALLASGMEVAPSLYNFLRNLKNEGYNVDGLPSSLAAFKRELAEKGAVMGDYAGEAQRIFMETGEPLWITAEQYRQWAREVLSPERFEEVEKHYGKAPGSLLAKGDSLAVAAISYGNILIFPQPRPSLGDDEFRLQHGVKTPPPHSYLAPYLYMQKGFDADIMIHFGTHGNLEFTPGKNAAMSRGDWADVLIGNRPHFYFYTTANVGEAVIAKRRSHAVMVTHLTPPYVESGMRSRYARLLEQIHSAIADPKTNTISLKKQIIEEGIHRDLGLDSVLGKPFTDDELEMIDGFIEELANEKITGAYYVMGKPYSPEDMRTTVEAIAADNLAYRRARQDFEAGKLRESQLKDFKFVSHRYLPQAKRDVASSFVYDDESSAPEDLKESVAVRKLLEDSPSSELKAMTDAMSGKPVRPAPGGDPVMNSNVLPTGRNMYSINAEATPDERAWETGVMLAEQTIADYRRKHGEYPEKISYTFWAGEFITSGGATIAQALRMLGVEPVRDDQGRVMDLKLTPSAELGRPRINIHVQVSGQLRDIASSRLKMITEAVKLAAAAEDDKYPNYVAEGTLKQERELLDRGESPKRARELSSMRVFGPVNDGYSTGMLGLTERSGKWKDRSELADGYMNNMCAMYGDEDNWGVANVSTLRAAVSGTELIVQPRQSNTWGPLSLDHVYEFTGGLSLAATEINGKEPDAMMADYRNTYLPRMQDTKQAVAVETRATILNPRFISERMKGDATTAAMFGEIFRNIFGWSATRTSALSPTIYDDLYETYIEDCNGLGIEEYFQRVNPAALQEMTATMLESARKGYWKTSPERIKTTAMLHARVTEKSGAPCTEFVCANGRLTEYIAGNLDKGQADAYKESIAKAVGGDGGIVMKRERLNEMQDEVAAPVNTIIIILTVLVLVGCVLFVARRRKSQSRGNISSRREDVDKND